MNIYGEAAELARIFTVKRLKHANRYFWRTYTGAELDYVEERDGVLSGFGFKFSAKTAKAPQTWLSTYHNAPSNR